MIKAKAIASQINDFVSGMKRTVADVLHGRLNASVSVKDIFRAQIDWLGFQKSELVASQCQHKHVLSALKLIGKYCRF